MTHIVTDADVRTGRKARGMLGRFRDRASETLSNVPLVEDLLEKAQARARKSAALKKSMDPLWRLVRSYVRDSYREAHPGAVAWALAALMYVVSPVDAIPDRLPGGLRDDERVVEWVTERIEATLSAYVAWEESLGASTELVPTAGSDVTSTMSLEVAVLGRLDASLFHRVEGEERSSAPPIAANAELMAGAQIADALQAGQIVRVLPTDAFKAWKDGAVKILEAKDGSGNLGSVYKPGTPGTKAQFRYGTIGEGAALEAAKAGFQVASAVTLQYYLARIDQQLGNIDREVRAGRQDTRDERYGSIEAARKQCDTAERVLAGASGLGQHDALRLDLAAHDLDQTFETLQASVTSFCERVDDLDVSSKSSLEKLLKEASGTVLTDTQLLLYAAVVRHRIGGLHTFLLSQDGEHRAQIALDDHDARHREMVGVLELTQAAFQKLHMPKRRLDELFPKLGGPERALRDYSDGTQGTRELLAAPQHLLPPFTPQEPFVMDLRLGQNRELEVEWAYLQPAA